MGLAARKDRVTQAELAKRIAEIPVPLDFSTALVGAGFKSARLVGKEGVVLTSEVPAASNNISLIAEVKRASPSAGIIRAEFDPVAIARTYAANGAAAISVLTEEKYFQGSLDYLKKIRQAVNVPLLCKDFIHDSYQVYEARAYGADAVLLIVAMLAPVHLAELLYLSHHLGMACLVEVHNEAELGVALYSGARIIGINNRDLQTFKVDVNTTASLLPLVPADKIVVSESGIKTREDIRNLKQLGVNAVLIGEALMASNNITARMKELL